MLRAKGPLCVSFDRLQLRRHRNKNVQRCSVDGWKTACEDATRARSNAEPAAMEGVPALVKSDEDTKACRMASSRSRKSASSGAEGVLTVVSAREATRKRLIDCSKREHGGGSNLSLPAVPIAAVRT